MLLSMLVLPHARASEDKRLAIDTSMIKQRETRFQWSEGSMMPADVLTKGKERGHVDLLRQVIDQADV